MFAPDKLLSWLERSRTSNTTTWLAILTPVSRAFCPSLRLFDGWDALRHQRELAQLEGAYGELSTLRDEMLVKLDGLKRRKQSEIQVMPTATLPRTKKRKLGSRVSTDEHFTGLHGGTWGPMQA